MAALVRLAPKVSGGMCADAMSEGIMRLA